ncbi:MAG: hypothetical protein OEW04_02975 [Nitrospirota bacterium]|nr:hypothetical protein [Nitrospirota bacterium]
MKGYNEDFRFEGGVLHVHLSGKFPNELLGRGENLFQRLIDACSAHNCKKALIDARDLQVDFDTMALFRAGQDAAFLTRVGLRIAMLAREDMLDPFFDTVVANRGGRIGIFTDMDSARDWLHK